MFPEKLNGRGEVISCLILGPFPKWKAEEEESAEHQLHLPLPINYEGNVPVCSPCCLAFSAVMGYTLKLWYKINPVTGFLGPATPQIMTQRLIISYEWSSFSYACPTSSYNLIYILPWDILPFFHSIWTTFTEFSACVWLAAGWLLAG